MGRGGRAERRAIVDLALRMTLENARNVMLARLGAIPGVHVTNPTAPSTASPISAPTRGVRRNCRNSCSKGPRGHVPGKEFGMEGRLRLSYCGTIREIKEGLERIPVGRSIRNRRMNCTSATASW